MLKFLDPRCVDSLKFSQILERIFLMHFLTENDFLVIFYIEHRHIANPPAYSLYTLSHTRFCEKRYLD